MAELFLPLESCSVVASQAGYRRIPCPLRPVAQPSLIAAFRGTWSHPVPGRLRFSSMSLTLLRSPATNAAFFDVWVEGKMRSNALDVFVQHRLEFDEDHRLLFVVVCGQQSPTQPADCVLGSTHGRCCIKRHSGAPTA